MTTTTDTLIQYNGRYYTGTDIIAMREWISCCRWNDLDSEDIHELSAHEVLAGINNNYGGGITQFMSDNSL